MSAGGEFTFRKEERICSRKLLDALFRGGGSHSMAVFPLRVVYMETDRVGNEPQAQMLVSVPKRHFKRAVKRNRVKRQVREAYRLHKGVVLDRMSGHPGRKAAMAFIWLDDRLHDSSEVGKSVERLLRRISEKL